MRRRLAEIYHFTVWLLLRCCIIDCSRDDVRERMYEPRTERKAWPTGMSAETEAALAFAKELFSAENERIRHIDDKAKSLLSATSILFTLTGGLIAVTASRDIPLYRAIVCAAFALLLVTLFLLLGVLFGINRFAEPELTQEIAGKLIRGNHGGLINEYREATWVNSRVREFLVDSYRAARRVFLFSMLLLGIAGLCILFTDRPTDILAKRLLNDPEFIEKVKGPKGDSGPVGPMGPPAPAVQVSAAATASPSLNDSSSLRPKAPREKSTKPRR
jgi:hypothetical protein